VIALAETPRLLGEKAFDLVQLSRSLDDYAPELRELKQRGFLREDSTLESGYRTGAEVML
jgi:hypothetical protein